MENSEKLVSIPEMTEIIKKNFTQQVEVITPELAMEYLKKNTDNRPMRERHVRELAKEMEEGRWNLLVIPTNLIGTEYCWMVNIL